MKQRVLTTPPQKTISGQQYKYILSLLNDRLPPPSTFHIRLLPTMKSAIDKAGKRLFAQDDDARQYAAADTVSEEYVAVSTDAEDTDHQTVCLQFSFLLHTLPMRFAKSLPHAETDPRAQHDVPPGLSERDTTVLRIVKRRANVLDKSFNLCGARFGWTFVIGTYPPSPLLSALHPPLRSPRRARIRRLMFSVVLQQSYLS